MAGTKAAVVSKRLKSWSGADKRRVVGAEGVGKASTVDEVGRHNRRRAFAYLLRSWFAEVGLACLSLYCKV